METVVTKLLSFSFLNPNYSRRFEFRRFSSSLCISALSDAVSLGLLTRPDFPILHREVNGSKKLVYLDNAATSQKPTAVLKALQNYYETYNSNVHRGIHYLSAKATDEYVLARKKVAAFVSASDSAEIVFTRNATEAINLVAYSWRLSNLRLGHEVILTMAEHHSAIVPSRIVAQKTGAVLKFLDLSEDEVSDLDKLKETLSRKTKLVVVYHVSNVLDFVHWAHDVGAKVLVDACQSIPHIVNVQRLGADFLVASSHKMCGPTGIGFLYGKSDLLSAMPLFLGVGEMIPDIFLDHSTYADPPSSEKFASCIPLVVKLSYNKCKNSNSIGARLADFSNKRTYSTLKFLKPASERLTSSFQSSNNPSQRYSSRCNHSLNIASGETSSILQSSSLQHWFKNWQELRKHKLTASTFAGAVGFWPRRRVQLWLEKIGAIEPFFGNLATCWSNIKEEEALERYKLITGNTVLFPNFQVYGNKNPEDDWLGASPDGLVDRLVYDLPSRGVLEIKCPFFDGDMTRASPWKRVPCYCIPQAQGLMEILDRDWMDFYVWTPKGSSLFRINRDLEYWGLLNIALSDFWWKHVQPARELCRKSVISDPLKQLRYLKPAPRHELLSYIVCESKRIVDNSNLLMREINGKLQN